MQNDWALKLATIVIIVAVTALITHLVTRFLKHVLMHEANLLPSSSIFINLARSVIWIVAICIILDTCFNVNVSAVIAALGVGGIAISLGFQDTISNLIGGLQVSLTKLVQPGDHIRVGTDSGIVKDVTWRHTTILNSLGETAVIPNSMINKASLVKLHTVRRVALPFLVHSSGEDLDQRAKDIEQACRHALTQVSGVTEGPKVVFTEITDSGFKGKATFTLADEKKVGEATDKVLRAIAPFMRTADPAEKA